MPFGIIPDSAFGFAGIPRVSAPNTRPHTARGLGIHGARNAKKDPDTRDQTLRLPAGFAPKSVWVASQRKASVR